MKVDAPPIADEKGLVDDRIESLSHGQGTIPSYNRSSNVRRALAGIVLFLSVGYLFGGLGDYRLVQPHRHSDLHVEGTGDLAPYWGGIIDKGMRLAVKQGHCHSHEEHTAKHGKHHDHGNGHHKGKHGDHHDHHDHHDHGNHGKHGKHGKHHDHPPPFIPPRMAEKLFLEVPNNDSVRAASWRYTDHAHIAGSGWDFVDAITLKSEWEAALGLPLSGSEDFIFESGSQESQDRVLNAEGKMGVWIDTYYPTMNTPVSSLVTLHSDPPFHAKLQEDIVEGDPDSVLRDEVRVFHGLSVSGHVKGQYVYAGYGRKKDFDLLQAHGIDFKGKIVVTKYGGVFRGLKIKAAQEAGAVGVLIYDDPADDGEYTEERGYKAYPDGPARQPSSVQRGSVQFISKYSGDPVTPGKPAYRNATRTEGENIPSIPSLPISYEDVLPILKALNGKGSKVSDFGQEWVGGLGYKGVEYWTGPSDVELELKNEVNTRIMPIWNVMATIPGHISDEVVVVGNHRDAWVLGAGDPSSGTASMYEMIRGLGDLLRKGWKPMRTIILASWDAEEYGLIGSVEWTEDFGDWLSAHAVAYLNMDVSVSGKRFEAGASPSLAGLLRQSAERVLTSADSSKTVWDARLDGEDFDAWRAAQQGLMLDIAETTKMDDHAVRPLGSGSDFTSFLQRFGIASSNIGYSAGPKDPVYHYHSIYDSFTWQEIFADPGFHRHVDAAKVFGLMTLGMADSLVLPINTTHYALELIYYRSKVETIAKETNQTSGLDMTALNHAIHKLINSSMALDHKRSVTLRKLEKLLPKPKKRQAQGALGKLIDLFHRLTACCGSSVRPEVGRGVHHVGTWTPSIVEVDRTGWPDIPKIPKIPGLPHSPEPEPPKKPDHPHPPHEPAHPSPPPPPPPPPPHHPPHQPPPPPHIPKDKLKEIKHLLLEIKQINSVLQSFEGGFISQEGIKDREWYRHKGVAPGKWLGYGATTFPALTEALTIDHSTEMAQREADELAEMINKMAQKLSKAA